MSNARDNLIAQYCKRKKDHDELDKKVRDGFFIINKLKQQDSKNLNYKKILIKLKIG